MIALRAKKLSNGQFHLFIDSYEDGKRRKEYLKIYVSEDYTQPEKDKNGKILYDEKGKPKFKKVKSEDKVSWELANKVRAGTENKVNTDNYGFDEKSKKNANFTEFFSDFEEKYSNKDKRLATACLTHFNTFNDDKNVLANKLTEDYIKDFAKYLKNNLNGETPYNYFKIFKQVVKRAYKAGMLKTNFAEAVSVKKVNGEPKDVLNMKEIQILFKTPANNNDVKRAFIFSCLTGLDFNDVKYLFKWSNVKDMQEGIMIAGNRGKTGKNYAIPLTDDAVQLLGDRKSSDELVFNLPSHGGTCKSLETWVKKAGITKHITFHCARHSFGTNLIYYGADMKVASKLLTHSKLTETDRYVRSAEAMKEKALDRLPKLSSAL